MVQLLLNHCLLHFMVHSNLINFIMLIKNFPCICIYCSVTMVCFVQSAFCYTLYIQLCHLYYSELKMTEELLKHVFKKCSSFS